MKLIVGLGNPGKKYENTRHNVGWFALDALAKKLVSKQLIMGKWKLKRKLQAHVFEGKDLVLARPITFMNNSGMAVKSLIANYPEVIEDPRQGRDSITELLNLWILHDDVDLPLEKLKIVQGRGAAGHKGVMSVIGELGTIDFVRFRLGVGRPHSGRAMKNGKKVTKFDTSEEIEDFVLASFLPTEADEVRKLIKKTIKAIEIALEKGIEKAMNRFN